MTHTPRMPCDPPLPQAASRRLAASRQSLLMTALARFGSPPMNIACSWAEAGAAMVLSLRRDGWMLPLDLLRSTVYMHL